MTSFLLIILFIIISIIAFGAIIQTKLLDSVVLFMGVGLISTLIFFLLQAPDVALTEIVIGTGVSSVIFLMALKHFGVKA